MRITSGHLGGRVIRTPDGAVRPTQSRVRQSVFSSLGGRMDGWRVADLFAGSGALGLEAWSRGADSVLWVESDPRVYAQLRRTVRTYCPDAADRAVCRRADVLRWTWTSPEMEPFDLILSDPPYVLARSAAETVLRETVRRGMIRPGGWAVMEMAARDAAPTADGWSRVRDRVMGDTRVALYRRILAGAEDVPKPDDKHESGGNLCGDL